MTDDRLLRAFEVNRLFARKLKQLRENANISQQELGNRAGLKRGTIAAIEGQSQTVNLGQLYALADALNLEPRDLLPERPITTDELAYFERIRQQLLAMPPT